MLSKFGSVVKSNSVSNVLFQFVYNGIGRLFCGLSGKFCEGYESTQTFIDRVNGVHVGVEHAISFPIAQTSLVCDNLWSLMNGYSVGYP